MRSVRPLVIAHRGASHVAPENTLPAFVRAADMGANMIELDVQRSADGVLVVIHDDDTRRVASGAGGSVATLTGDELHHLDLGGGACIPTLDEVLDFVRASGIAVNVELKTPGIEEGVIAAVHTWGLHEVALLSSFDVDVLARVHILAPGLRLALLSASDTMLPRARVPEDYPLPILRRLGAVAWHPHYQLVNRSIVRAVHHAGFRVHVWTVDHPAAMRRMVRLDVDGIITDDPDILSALLDEDLTPE